MAACYQKSEQDLKALKCYNDGIERIPAGLNLRYFRAALLIRLKRVSEAIADYKAILANSVKPGKLNERIADTAMIIRDYTTALGYYQAALEVQSNLMVLHYKVARVYGFKKDFGESLNWLRAAQMLGFRDYDDLQNDRAFVNLLKQESLRDIFGEE